MSLAQGDQILMTRFVFDNARQVLKGQELVGQWGGKGAERLGLTGEVGKHAFEQRDQGVAVGDVQLLAQVLEIGLRRGHALAYRFGFPPCPSSRAGPVRSAAGCRTRGSFPR